MRNSEKYGERFIEILEIIYAIIFACGIAKMLEEIFMKKSNGIHPLQILSSVVVTIFVLVRFFFAPSKNVKILVTKSSEEGIKWWRKWIMPGDIVVLLAHSYFFYMMCLEIINIELFYRWFFILLAWNTVWLFTIWGRLKKEKISYIKTWSINNTVFVALYLITLVIYFKSNIVLWIIGMLWFILAIINSLIDLFRTYNDYFSTE